MIFVLLPLVLLAAGLLYQRIGHSLDRRRVPRPGALVKGSYGTIHLHRQGTGFPVVVLEAGIAGTSLGWAIVQPRIAEFTAVCSYDRLGLGWSTPIDRPRTVANMTAELHDALRAAEIRPPYVLVGHSFGGLLMRAFAQRYPELSSALVLVDPVSVEQWSDASDAEHHRLRRGIKLSRRGQLLARVGVVRATLALLASGSRIVPKLIGRTAAPGASKFLDRLVGQIRRLPKEVWPAIQCHWSDPKCYAGMAEYLRALPKCAKEAASIDLPAHLKQVILSADTATPAELAERDRWAAASTCATHLRLTGTGHWIQLDQPDALIDIIRDVVEELRPRA